jgi:hypothetical protein
MFVRNQISVIHQTHVFFYSTFKSWPFFCHQDDDSVGEETVAYPGNFFSWGVQQIQLRAESRENGDLGAVAP